MVRIHEKKHQGGAASVNIKLLSLSVLLFSSVALVGSYVYIFSSLSGARHTEGETSDELNPPKDAIIVAPGGVESSSSRRRADAASPVGDSKATVGYAVSLTGCGSDPLTDGGAVLKHSIHLSSIQNPSSGSKYDYKVYAIVHPAAQSCAHELADVGYEILMRDVPVPVKDIKGDLLRTYVSTNGCCGEKEYIKLHAYTLVEHPIVVHLDLDTMILKPMDDLFDVMLDGVQNSPAAAKIPVNFDKPLPQEGQIDAFFTRDWNMARPKMTGKKVGVQGGFLVLRPDMNTYKEFCDIIREGDFRKGTGWGGLKFGPFYGAMTFQGIVPYYYDALHPNTAVELDPCVYNHMSHNPRDKKTVNEVVQGNCRDGRTECPDCREMNLEDIKTVHYTLCMKPWWCLPHSPNVLQHRLCRKLHREWFRVRSDLEKSWGRSGYGPEKFDREQMFGFCKRQGHVGYLPIEAPKV